MAKQRVQIKSLADMDRAGINFSNLGRRVVVTAYRSVTDNDPDSVVGGILEYYESSQAGLAFRMQGDGRVTQIRNWPWYTVEYDTVHVQINPAS